MIVEVSISTNSEQGCEKSLEIKRTISKWLLSIIFNLCKGQVEKEIALDIKAVQLYEITIEHLTGKQIQEK